MIGFYFDSIEGRIYKCEIPTSTTPLYRIRTGHEGDWPRGRILPGNISGTVFNRAMKLFVFSSNSDNTSVTYSVTTNLDVTENVESFTGYFVNGIYNNNSQASNCIYFTPNQFLAEQYNSLGNPYPVQTDSVSHYAYLAGINLGGTTSEVAVVQSTKFDEWWNDPTTVGGDIKSMIELHKENGFEYPVFKGESETVTATEAVFVNIETMNAWRGFIRTGTGPDVPSLGSSFGYTISPSNKNFQQVSAKDMILLTDGGVNIYGLGYSGCSLYAYDVNEYLTVNMLSVVPELSSGEQGSTAYPIRRSVEFNPPATNPYIFYDGNYFYFVFTEKNAATGFTFYSDSPDPSAIANRYFQCIDRGERNLCYRMVITQSNLRPATWAEYEAWKADPSTRPTGLGDIWTDYEIDDVLPPENGVTSDPYAPGGGDSSATDGDTDGTWTLPDDYVDPNGHSAVDSTRAGLFRAYAMSQSECNELGQFLWSAGIIDILTKYFDNVMSVIIGMIEYPFQITEQEDPERIGFGWLTSTLQPTALTGAPLSSEYQVLDFGSIVYNGYSGTFYDYQPYSTVQLYLPYIGFVPLKMNEIINAKLSLRYIVSLTSGSATAVIESSSVGIIGTYNCQLGRMLPLSENDFSRLFQAAMKVAVAAVSAGVAAGAGTSSVLSGAGSAMVAGADYSQQSTYNLAMAGYGVPPAESVQYANYSRVPNAPIANRLAGRMSYNAIQSVVGANAQIQRNGSFEVNAGRCMNQHAFILVSTPHQMPTGYQKYLGYPCNTSGKVGDFSGFTTFRELHLNIPGAYSVELNELESIMANGVIL